jgi:hypothetical protein
MHSLLLLLRWTSLSAAIVLCCSSSAAPPASEQAAPDRRPAPAVAGKKEAPRFQDYPAAEKYAGRHATVRLVSARDRKYRTKLTQGASDKTNFAGDQILVLWGCGTACMEGALVSARTGTVSWLPYFIIGCDMACVNFEDRKLVDFRPDSKLLILNGQRGSVTGDATGVPGSFYFLFENGRYRLLHSVDAELAKFD